MEGIDTSRLNVKVADRLRIKISMSKSYKSDESSKSRKQVPAQPLPRHLNEVDNPDPEPSSDEEQTNAWVIMPLDGLNTELNVKIEAGIRAIIGSEVDMYNYISDVDGLLLWRAAVMSDEQAEEVRKLEGVSLPLIDLMITLEYRLIPRVGRRSREGRHLLFAWLNGGDAGL